MTTADETAGGLSETEHSTQLRRAVVASTVGTVIEAYDFLLYVLVAPLVFAKLYFPGSDPLVGTLQAFGVYAVGFAARPVGAAIFGHWGDRLGRKSALIATLLLMGVATFLVAFVPGYETIGVWGAVILTGVGLWIRLGILETPTFAKLVAEDRVERAPMAAVLRKHPKEIILTALARMAEQAPFYIFTAFVFTYGTTAAVASRNLLLG